MTVSARARADQPHRDVVGLLRLGLVRGGAGQDDAVADAFDGDVGIGNDLLDRRADAVEVAGDRDIEAGHLPAVGVEEKHVGLADRDADDVGAARRADHGVGDLRIGDQHVLDVARQIDDHRLADAERHRARAEIAGGDVDGLRRLLGQRQFAGVGGRLRKRATTRDEPARTVARIAAPAAMMYLRCASLGRYSCSRRSARC